MTGRRELLYRRACARCRAISLIVTLLAAGGLQRRPLDAAAANEIALSSGSKARLIIRHNDRLLHGAPAIAAVAAAAAPGWMALALFLFLLIVLRAL